MDRPFFYFNVREASRINTAQNNLFKRILGIPQSAANESIFLFTGLIPLYSQIEQSCLLLIGQLINLSTDRFERRTLLRAAVTSVPLTKRWNNILQKHHLPDLLSLLEHPIPYQSWKAQIKNSVLKETRLAAQNAIATKSTLALWKDLTQLPSPNRIFPVGLPPHLRRAQIARAQLLTQTYPLKKRLLKIGKSSNALCPLCLKEEEDVFHFVASCDNLQPHRTKFIGNLNQAFPDPGISSTLDQDNPQAFTSLVLFPDPTLSRSASSTSTLIALRFILQIHLSRAAITTCIS